MTAHRRNPPTPSHLLAHARRMRQAPTLAEHKLWQSLRRKQLDEDRQRQEYLENLGYTVLRFTNTQMREELPAVLAEIARHCGIEG